MTKKNFKSQKTYIITEKLEVGKSSEALVRSVLLLAQIVNELTWSYKQDEHRKRQEKEPYIVIRKPHGSML
jgi:hypothetical protein